MKFQLQHPLFCLSSVVSVRFCVLHVMSEVVDLLYDFSIYQLRSWQSITVCLTA